MIFLQLIDKLSVRTPVGEVKLKVLKEIAKEYQVDWDTTESEAELLKPPEKLIVHFSLYINVYDPLGQIRVSYSILLSFCVGWTSDLCECFYHAYQVHTRAICSTKQPTISQVICEPFISPNNSPWFLSLFRVY